MATLHDDDKSESILLEAQRIVHGDRGAHYAHPLLNFRAYGRLAGAVIARWLESSLSPEDLVRYHALWPQGFPDIPPRIVGLLKAEIKIDREANRPHRDNRVDIAGYSETTEMVLQLERAIAEALAQGGGPEDIARLIMGEQAAHAKESGDTVSAVGQAA